MSAVSWSSEEARPYLHHLLEHLHAAGHGRLLVHEAFSSSRRRTHPSPTSQAAWLTRSPLHSVCTRLMPLTPFKTTSDLPASSLSSSTPTAALATCALEERLTRQSSYVRGSESVVCVGTNSNKSGSQSTHLGPWCSSSSSSSCWSSALEGGAGGLVLDRCRRPVGAADGRCCCSCSSS